MKADTKAIQAIHDHVITHNPRVSVSHNDHTTWNLHIKNVQEEDRGQYMCQINTDPMKSQVIDIFLSKLEITLRSEKSNIRGMGNVWKHLIYGKWVNGLSHFQVCNLFTNKRYTVAVGGSASFDFSNIKLSSKYTMKE